jgi:hypothetical protein
MFGLFADFSFIMVIYLLKFRHYEKATKFEKNLLPVLSKQLFLLSSVKQVGDFFQIFVTFSEKLDFIKVWLRAIGSFVDTGTDFLIKSGIKPCIHLLKISIFTKSCHRQTYQNYAQPPQRLQSSDFQWFFSIKNQLNIYEFCYCEDY